MYKFEVYTAKDGQSHFRFRAANGEIMFASEGYTRKEAAIASILSIKQHVVEATIVDLTIEKKLGDKNG